MIDFPDRNENGIPDAFEERPPLSEILGFEEPIEDDSAEVVLEGSPPKPKGTEGICSDGIHYFDERPWVISTSCKCGFLRREVFPVGS